MRMVKAGLVCGMAALALAGCNRKGEDAEEPARPAASEPAAAQQPTAKPAARIETPRRKSGLWEQRVSMGDMTQVAAICLDKAVDAKLSWWGDQGVRSACEKNLVSRQMDGSWRFSSVCDMGTGGVTTTSGVVSGDFNGRYVVKSESSTTGAATPQMNGRHSSSVEATYKGPCPAGMRPGDMELPGGQRVNMLDLQVPGMQ